ncbi:MAG: IS66 family insertion sequence element accessory protein TnpB [Acidobacteria bacterium]|nr:IS66 family insertion sequence element accessory protein TnpB [Acidobacteriota bacterium]MCB9396526.1 IS66 family insertion sequence element accessory protein TnpB [Acidobacteriota bacterium]MCB9398494.1 IS66 family insertion sequence element accessory protein TnpB [Acidobacteriota bacterium]
MLPQSGKVYLALGNTDMRKSINGLAILVEGFLGKDLFGGDFFVFCNRPRNRIKILYWDQNGFCLWLKRLEEHRFRWPETEAEVLEIDQRALAWLLAGLDVSQAHEKLHYRQVT